MKQKKRAEKSAVSKSVPAPAQESAAVPAPSPEVSASAAALPVLTRGERTVTIAYLVLVFAAMIILTGNMSQILVALAVVAIFINWKQSLQTVREHLCLPVFGFIALFVVYCLAGSYSPFNESAMREMYRGMAALSLAGFALMTFRKKHVPLLLWGVVIICGIVGFLAVDAASAQLLYRPFVVVADFLANADLYAPLNTFVDQRLTTLIHNSNVGAGLLALGMFIGLYHLRTLENKKSRLAAAFLLGINAVAFFLCLSRGAMLAFGIALLVWLFIAPKGQRIRLFLLMLVSAAVTMAFSVVSLPFLGMGSVLPELLVLFCGPVILLADQLLSDRLAGVLNAHMKITVASGAVLVALAAVYLVAAMTVTGPFRLNANETMWRKLDLAPGTYTYETDMDEGVTFTVQIVEEKYVRMDTKVLVCDSAAGDASFVVPENAAKVQIHFASKTGGEIRSVVFSDGTEVKLDYSLLPRSLANRLQDNLLKSTSYLQRVQYLVDALKIWMTSPIIGRGLGSSENLFPSVQPYYYESLFVHNHLLQYLADTGLVGLAAFLMVAGGVLWLLIRRLRRGYDELAAMLVVAWVMMNVHGLMEISFSIRPYLVAAMVLLAIAVIQFGDEPLFVKKKESVKKLGTAAVACFCAALLLFDGLVVTYRLAYASAERFETTSLEKFMSRMETYITLDVYDDEGYKQTYLQQGLNDPRYQSKVDNYARALRKTKTYNNCSFLAVNYYLPIGELTEAFACSRDGIAQLASMNEPWNYELENYRDIFLSVISADWMEEYFGGIEAYYNMFTAYNDGRIDPVELTEENQQFLDTVIALRQAGVSAEEAYAQLSTFVKE